MEERNKSCFDVSSGMLHIIAMVTMLIDHTLKKITISNEFLLILGRLAFPIFAFMIVEGYFYTHNYKKYVLRVLLFAIISEIPYDLMKSEMLFDPLDQNVLWTFLIALLCIKVIDLSKQKNKKAIYILTSIIMTLIGFVLSTLCLTDYHGMGFLMVVIFYFFRESKVSNRVLQFILMFIINVLFLGPFEGMVMFSIFGMHLEIPLQGFALLSLIPIWMYKGRQGYHSQPFKYVCYAFYPVHMLILYLVSV